MNHRIFVLCRRNSWLNIPSRWWMRENALTWIEYIYIFIILFFFTCAMLSWKKKKIKKNKKIKTKIEFQVVQRKNKIWKKFNRISFFSPLTFWLLIFVLFGEKSLPQNKTYSSQLSHQHRFSTFEFSNFFSFFLSWMLRAGVLFLHCTFK